MYKYILHTERRSGSHRQHRGKTVDVCVKKNLVRAHAVALTDRGKSVVVLVEAKVSPVGTDRSISCRKGATRVACAAG
jgi:hypothetical protein